jgi:crossover junction endodeoxyribonuclease RuvC
MMRPLRVIGLDLSLTGTGVAATHASTGEARLSCRTVAPRRRPSMTTIDHARLHEIVAAVMLAAQCKPDLVVIERPLQIAGKGDISIRLAELHGPIKHWLYCQGIPYVDVHLTHVKQYATGSGSAQKPDVLAAVIARYGTCGEHGLTVSTYDEADAVSLLMQALDHYGSTLPDGYPLPEVPPSHREAIFKTNWPALGGHR